MQFVATSVSFLLTRAAKSGFDSFGMHTDEAGFTYRWSAWYLFPLSWWWKTHVLRFLDALSLGLWTLSSLAAIFVDDSRETRNASAEVHNCGASARVEHR